MKLHTVGVGKKTAEAFFALLENADVEKVMDVRLNNRSQLLGFSKGRDLEYFCEKCHGMATGKTCPHSENDRINISGTEQREMLSKGLEVPIEFGRPEVVEILRNYYATVDQ